jgi:hypothetical protein
MLEVSFPYRQRLPAVGRIGNQGDIVTETKAQMRALLDKHEQARAEGGSVSYWIPREHPR